MDVFVFEREMAGRRYRVAAQSVWDRARQRAVSRQTTLGPVESGARVDLAAARAVGTKRVGDVGALAWVAEQLEVIGIVDRICGSASDPKQPSLGEMVLAVALQRACAPGPKRDLDEFLDGSLARISCLSGRTFTGLRFHRMAANVSDRDLERVQIDLARAAVRKFELTTDVLAFDTTNFDTHIDTTTPGDLAKRGHAKSKRSDLRVVGLAVLASETGHVPLLYRTYPGNGSDQGVLEDCLDGLGQLHDALDEGEQRRRPPQRTLVRDGGSWSEQLELDLDFEGYFTLISLPLSHGAAEQALVAAAATRAMRSLKGKLHETRAFRMRARVGKLDRTLVVVESKELLAGQKRGIAKALRKARAEFASLERQVATGRVRRSKLARRAEATLGREHLAQFVRYEVGGTEKEPTFRWWIDDTKRAELERTRLGKRVLCTDRHNWSDERIVHAFRGQWNVEELFRRSKKGGVVPWGPSFQWADGSLRLHTFATVLGLTLVSLAQLAMNTELSAKAMMTALASIRATLVRPQSKTNGRAPTYYLPPPLTPFQARAVRQFGLDRWMPALLSIRPGRRSGAANKDAA